MSQKIGSMYYDIGANTTALKTGLTESKSGLAGLAKGFGSTLLTAAAFTAAIKATGDAIKDTINDTVEYGKQVRDLSLLIGSSAEESSKLIQAADDVFISYETMTKAMQAAIRGGVEPTIAGMGELSNQYLAIQDPIARTKFLMDTFGRSGADLAPLMQLGKDGIKELGDEAEKTGLVMDEKAVKAAIRYKEELDKLNDTIGGFKTQAGLYAIDMINLALGMVDASAKLNTNSLYDFLESSRKGWTLWFTWLKAHKDDASVTMKDIYLYDTLGLSMTDFAGTLTTAERSLIAYAQAGGYATDKSKDLEDEIEAAKEATLAAAEATMEYQKAIEDIGSMGNNFQGIVGYAEEYTDIQQEIKDKQYEINLLSQGMTLDGATISATDAKGKIVELQGEILTLQGNLKGLADTFALEMAMAIITADGAVSEAERQAYWAMAIELGVVTQEAADAAESAFTTAFTNATSAFAMSMPTSMNIGVNFIAGPLPVYGPTAPVAPTVIPTVPAWSPPGPPWVRKGSSTTPGKHGWYENATTGEYKEFANGGRFNANQDMMVGEEGIEMVKFDRPGVIIPNNQLGGGGNNNDMILKLLTQIAKNKSFDEVRLGRIIRDSVLQAVG
jgi:hypothetical protein